MESPLGHEAVSGAEVVVECEGVKVQETAQFVTLVDESRRLKSENLPFLCHTKRWELGMGWVLRNQAVGTRYPSKPFAYQGSVLRIKLVPLERESRELDGVHLGVNERLRDADLVNEQPAWHRLVQVHGIQRMSILVVLDCQYLERN